DELFGQRLGVQIGANRTAVNLPGKTPQVSVPEQGGVYRVDADLSKSAFDGELDGLHERKIEYKKKPNDVQLVVRTMFNKEAADRDGFVRLGSGAVRLVANGKDYYPVGTLE